MNKITFTLFSLALSLTYMQAQTANDAIKPYVKPFRPGVNLGYFPGLNNENLADLAAGNEANDIQGIGAKTIRTGIFNEFVEVWGYDFLIPTYNYFKERGLVENTVIIGFPAAWQRDQTFHCSGKQSTMFANLYDPIFDNGENGTPVNDNNYLALYLFKLVNQYKDHVRFWEIWNEPGSDLPTGFQVGWRQPGFPGNWWENNPDPCDNILHAPIYHYVRTLRVAYEVIKFIDPDAYVSVAGFGYPAFLDAVLRNTDNPVDGSPTTEYPLGGGAYFDVFGNHSYPHFDGSTTNFDEGRFERHSDRAADGIITRRLEFEAVLSKYGYDGITYPLKPSIITEVNVPRKQFGDYIGGKEVQINFIIKAFIKAKTNNVYVIHPYNMVERDDYDAATTEFGVMGMYEQFNTPGQQVPTGEAIAYKTTSDLLFNTKYDLIQTTAMQLPNGVRGHAFSDENGEFIYALWAETTIDFSEAASATYSFPANLNLGNLEAIRWDYSQNQQLGQIAPTNISLDALPIFLRAANGTPPPPPPTSDLPNLQLQLSTTNPQPGIYSSTTLNLTVTNASLYMANNVVIQLPLTNGELAFTGQTEDAGTYYNWNGEWIIPNIPANTDYTLSVNVFTLTDNAINVFSQIIAMEQTDANSIPNNGICCQVQEDDEAFLELNAGAICTCPAFVAPVCGSDGQTYNNACEAECAGITQYLEGECGGNSETIDLSLELSVDKPNFVIYETVTASFIIRNNGNLTAQNIKVILKGHQADFAYAGHTLSEGEYIDWEGEWQIPAIAPGAAATLDVGLFTLQDSASRTIFAQIAAAFPSDSDSTPDNNEGIEPTEDDEAAILITPSNNLNGNTEAFSRNAENAQVVTIQQLLPNPAIQYLKVRIYSKKEENVTLKVFNPHGQLLITQSTIVIKGVNMPTIDIDDLSSGIYFLAIEGTTGKIKPFRFVKQRL